MLNRCLFVLLFAAAACIAPARQVAITVLHTTDLHGHLFPCEDYDGRKNVGGLLRCATLIERIRGEAPNVLLLDCGDLYQGTAESLLTDGRIMIRALEWLRYDAWTIGNHEFDWGLEKLTALHDEAAVPMLAANIGARPTGEDPLPRVRPFLVKDVDGVRVAVIGLTTPGIPTWSRPDLLGACLFHKSVETLRRVMPRVREAKPDIILLAAHQGLRTYGDDHANEINAVAREFPEIDAIIGGHTHRVVTSQKVGKTLYTQAGYHGVWLGRLDLLYDTDAKRLLEKTADVIDVADRYPFHEGLKALLASELEAAEKHLEEELGVAVDRLDARAGDDGSSPVQMLICRAIRDAVDADIVIHGALTEDPLEAGPVRMADIWRIVPYENRIGVALLTPEDICRILEENAEYRGQTHFMGVLGATYRLQDGKVKDLRLAGGSAPHARKRYRVAMNSYVLASGGLRFKAAREVAEQLFARLDLTSVDTRGAVARYVKRHSPLSIEKLMGQSR